MHFHIFSFCFVKTKSQLAITREIRLYLHPHFLAEHSTSLHSEILPLSG
nr:MAG TPA: hypothetical protein [Caudoviricetes sp.]DAH93868.1 MAG TPA: hypothetical protein [Caudoviricetes sp.]